MLLDASHVLCCLSIFGFFVAESSLVLSYDNAGARKFDENMLRFQRLNSSDFKPRNSISY
jgi:hypothetical protein